MQVFAGSFIYLVFELIGELAGLSGAVGSFLAGMMIGRLDAFQWLERILSPFKVFFVALFFCLPGTTFGPGLYFGKPNADIDANTGTFPGQ